jgi:hypothetical protein
LTTPSRPLSVPPAPQKRNRFWRYFRSTLLVILVLLAGFLAFSAYFATRTPNWYHPLDARDPDVAKASAHYEQYGWINQRSNLDSVRRDVDQTIVLNENEINAYLATAFLPYQESKNSISGPQIIFSPGHITLAGRVKNIPAIGTGVLSLTFHFESLPPENPARDPSTRLRFCLDSASLGKLALPRWFIRERMARAVADLAPTADVIIQSHRRKPDAPSQANELRDIFRSLALEQPVPIPYEYHGGNGTSKDIRNVFLQAITIEDGKLIITLSANPLH